MRYFLVSLLLCILSNACNGQTYYNFTETTTSSTATKYSGSASTVTGTSLGLASGTAVLDLYFSLPGTNTPNKAAAATSSTTISQLVSSGAGQFYSGTITFGGGTSYNLYAISGLASTSTPAGFEITSTTFTSPKMAAGSLQLQFSNGTATYYVFTPPDADRVSIYKTTPPTLATGAGNTNTIGACNLSNCWDSTVTLSTVSALNPKNLSQAQLAANAQTDTGAPEIDGALMPQITLLLVSLFCMMHNRKLRGA